MKNRNALIIIAKYPEKGSVKTRIRGLSEEQRVELYTRLLNKTMEKLSSISGADTYMAFAPANTKDFFSRFKVGLIPLSDGDLGMRMHEAFHYTFLKGYEKVSLVGADIHDLSESIIIDSFNQLSDHDLVYGPARDGGYYLVGMQKLIKEVFNNVPWSSPMTLEISINNAKQAGYSVSQITVLSDIDTFEDAKRYGLI
jgi:rSAM/selenodomain-associated transferase 1